MHPGTQRLLQVRDQRGLVRVGLVQHDYLVPVPAQQLWMIADEHHHDDHRHQRESQPVRGGGQTGQQAQCESREVIRDLVLFQLGGPQPDDRQHAEQAQSHARGDRRGRQHAGHGEHADVDDKVGHHEVAAAVPREVQGKDEQADRQPIGGENRNLRHGILQVNNW